MIEVIGDLFSYSGEAIGHGVNCQGLMGAGIAVQFRRRYPSMYKSYQIHCQSGDLEPGGVFMYRGNDGRVVCNLASQDLPGADARYEWLASALMQTVDTLLVMGIHEMAIPQIGCGIGGLDWQAVKVILSLLEDPQDDKFQFIVYSLPTSQEAAQ